MPTPHIAAQPGDFAPAVLMPGDPKRAERIAHTLLDDPRLVTDVRGMLGFTGTVNGQPLSVMGSGMGQASASIYATELFRFYGVKRIIRVGTAGGIAPSVNVGDTIIAMGAHTDSSMNQLRIPGMNFSAVASFPLASAAVNAAQEGDKIHVGTIVSRDHFYFAPDGLFAKLADYGVLGVEMEAAALYGVAAEHGKEALAVLTISDHLFDGSRDMDAHERETQFQTSMRLAVAAALS